MMESLRMTKMWQDLMQHGTSPEKSVLVTNCESELAELMRQIDVMVAQKKEMWDRDKTYLNNQLTGKDQDLIVQKTLIHQKGLEITQLYQQCAGQEKMQKQLVKEYESQLAHVRAQVSSMKREYEKLHKRYSKHAQKNQDGEQSGNTEDEPQKELAKENNVKHERDLEMLRSQQRTLTEKYELLEQQATSYQKQLDRSRDLMNSTEMSLSSKVSILERELGEVNRSKETLESHIVRLKQSLEESLAAHRQTLLEKDDSQQQIHKLKQQHKQVTEEFGQCRLRNESVLSELQSNEMTMAKQHTDMKTLEQHIVEREVIIKSHHEKESQLLEEIKELKKKGMKSKDQCLKLKQELGELLDDRLDSTKDQEITHQMETNRRELESELHEMQTLQQKTAGSNMEFQKQLLDVQHTLQRRNAEVTVVNSQLDALRVENRHLRQTARQTGNTDRDLKLADAQLHDLQNAYAISIQTLEKQNSNLQYDLDSLNDCLKQAERECEQRLSRTLQDKKRSMQALKQQNDQKLQEVAHFESEKVETIQHEFDRSIAKYEQQNSQLHQKIKDLKSQVDEKNLSLKRIEMEHNDMSSFVSGVNDVVYTPSKHDHVPVHGLITSPSCTSPRSVIYHTHHDFIIPHAGSRTSSSSPVSAHTSVSMSECDHQHLPRKPHNTLLPPGDINGDTVMFPADQSVSRDLTHLSLLSVEDDEILDSIDDVTERFRADQEQRTQELQLKLDKHIHSLRLHTEATINKYGEMA